MKVILLILFVFFSCFACSSIVTKEAANELKETEFALIIDIINAKQVACAGARTSKCGLTLYGCSDERTYLCAQNVAIIDVSRISGLFR
jgi:hypothetical protein